LKVLTFPIFYKLYGCILILRDKYLTFPIFYKLYGCILILRDKYEHKAFEDK